MATTAPVPKPKILLVDLPDTCTKQLQSAGYNIRAGSFGSQFKVKASDGLAVVAGEGAALQKAGVVYAKTGRPQNALAFFEQALPARRAACIRDRVMAVQSGQEMP